MPEERNASLGTLAASEPARPPETRVLNSVAPVGIDVKTADSRVAAEDGEEEVAWRQRRPRTGLVLGALGVCAMILLVAGARRIGIGAHEQALASAAAPNFAVASTPASAPVQASAESNPNKAEAPSVWSNSFPGTESVPPPSVPSPTTGTLRLQRAAGSNGVWLDGALVHGPSAIVPCGAHELRVGVHGHPEEIDVPCGGEFSVTK